MKTNNIFWYVLDNEYHQMSHDYQYCFSTWTTIIASWATTRINRWQVVYVNNPWTCPTCPSCPSQYTSLECQTEYSLIPVSEVTENYCTSNYDLISPSDCPISSWTWDISRSAIYLNNIQYAGANNIYININDILDYSTTYVDSWTSFVVDVDWYNADTDYLADILTVQQYHPDSEDFTVAFVGGLTLILPYVVVALFVVFVRKLITKIFKS